MAATEWEAATGLILSGAATAGNTIRNTVGEPPTETGRQPNNLGIPLEAKAAEPGKRGQARVWQSEGAVRVTVAEQAATVSAVARVPVEEVVRIAAVVVAIASGTGRLGVVAIPEAAERLAATDVAEHRFARTVRAALPAWVAPGAAVAGAAEDEAAVAEGADKRMRASHDKENRMRLRTSNSTAWRISSGLLVIAVFCAFGVLSQSAPQSKQNSAPAAQTAFNTAEEAAQAFVEASAKYDVPTLLAILGSDGEDLVVSEDPVKEKNRAAAFAALAQEKFVVMADSQDRRAELIVGNEAWPLPIPIVKRNGKWYFDTKAGRQEILYRRIGENEFDAIKICRGFDDAQLEYASAKHDDSGLNQYAQRIISTPGKQDGLAWQNADGSWGGPVGEGAAKAMEEGYTTEGQPYHGYYFKVLKGQGPEGRLGAMSFLVEGAMIGGFALAAAPAQYRVTGVKTFIVSYEGIVYEKDLGPDTLTTFKNMELYNPDKTWHRTDAEE
jgi:hypothetical protein